MVKPTLRPARPGGREVVVTTESMIDSFIAPVAGWQKPHSDQSAMVCPPPSSSAPTWQDFAANEDWREAVVAYLRSDWRRAFKMWSVINDVVGESCQGSRFDVRAASFEVLQEVLQLRRERKIIRFKRRWIAILAAGNEVIPVEALQKPVVAWRSSGRLEPTARP